MGNSIKAKMLNTCDQHRDCLVRYDVPTGCPACEDALTARCNHAETRGRLKWCEEEIDRLKKREQEISNLESKILELEDRIAADLEDDSPCEEPRQPKEMAARRGLEVSPRNWVTGGDYE